MSTKNTKLDLHRISISDPVLTKENKLCPTIAAKPGVKGRLKTSHLWAPQNQPVFRCV